MSRRARAQISCSRYLCVCDIGKDALNCVLLTYCDLQNNLEVLSSVQQLIYDAATSHVVNSRHLGTVAKWKLPTFMRGCAFLFHNQTNMVKSWQPVNSRHFK